MNPALITAALPAGKTYAEALARAAKRAAHLWSSHEWMMEPEDKRIQELEDWCTRLCGGNRQAGELLAREGLHERAGAYDPHPLDPPPPEPDNPDDAAGGVVKGVGLGILIYVAVGVLWFAGRAVIAMMVD